MEAIVYRKSKGDDLPQIMDLLKALDLNTSNIIVDGFWVAVEGSRVVGCARIIEMEDGNIELASVAVVEEYRKKGIGSKIMQMLLSQEKRRPVYLMCRRTNQRFYEEQGFGEAEDNLLPAYYRQKVESKRRETKIDGLAMIKNR